MNKEEDILLGKDCFLHNHEYYYKEKIVHEAMRKYAKVIAIDFREFLLNDIFQLNIDIKDLFIEGNTFEDYLQSKQINHEK